VSPLWPVSDSNLKSGTAAVGQFATMRRWAARTVWVSLIGALLYISARAYSEHLLPLAVVVVVGVPFLYVVLAVDQSGFLLGGLGLGFRPKQWNIGPLLAIRTPEGWRLRHVWQWWLLRGEMTSFELTPKCLRWRHATLKASEPTAALALGASLVGAAALLNQDAILVLAAEAAAYALWPLVPRRNRNDGRWSVGLWLWRWLFRPAIAARTIAIAELHAANQGEIRPRDWDNRWVALAADGETYPEAIECCVGLHYGYASALDRGEVDRAGALLDRIIANLGSVPENLRRPFWVEPAFYTARFRHHHTLATQLLELAADPSSAIATGDLQRARAATHYAGGRPAAALAECEAAYAAMNGSPPTGWGLLDRDLLDALCEDVRRALSVDQPLRGQG